MRPRSNTGRDESGLGFPVMKRASRFITGRFLVTESPPDVRFHEDLHLIIYSPCGIVDEAAVNKVLVDLLRRETAAARPFNRFSDLSLVESFHLTFKYVFHVALHPRLSSAGRAAVMS